LGHLQLYKLWKEKEITSVKKLFGASAAWNRIIGLEINLQKVSAPCFSLHREGDLGFVKLTDLPRAMSVINEPAEEVGLVLLSSESQSSECALHNVVLLSLTLQFFFIVVLGGGTLWYLQKFFFFFSNQ
jgi:hypothetical protein